MELTSETYYSLEADKEYMSVHQYLDFVGYMGVKGCEERAMAKLHKKYKQKITNAMIVGSYVDSYFEGTLDKYKEEHPEIFTQKGELKAQYKQAEKMIARAERDELFMETLSGEKQKIFTAYLFGCNWKCKIDSYIKGVAITDLKTSVDIHKAWKVQDHGYVSFAEYWGYTIQMAVYQKIVEICTGEKLPCFISVITKEENPEIKVICIDQATLDHALNEVKMNMPTILMVKSGEVEPIRCGSCEWCHDTEVLKEPIGLEDLIME